jgi:hypothetical protein
MNENLGTDTRIKSTMYYSGSKRGYQGTYASNKRRKVDIQRLSRQVYRNRPELKCNTATTTTNIAAGGAWNVQPCRIDAGTGSDDRIGGKIRIWRIEVRGSADPIVDAYIILCKSTSLPANTNFTSQVGAYIVDEVNNNGFTELAHYTNPHGNEADQRIKFSYRFKGGLLTSFSSAASTSIVRNEITATFLNRSTAAANINLNVRIWYTDA